MRRGKRDMRALSIVFVAIAFVLALIPAAALRAQTAPACQVTYSIQSQWQDGFVADVTIRNAGAAAVNGWTLSWTFPGNQRITNIWNATTTVPSTSAAISATDAVWNRTIAAGGTANFGFQASYSGTNASPSAFALNGASCNGATTTTVGATTTSRATTTTTTTTVGQTTTTAGVTTTTAGGGGQHLANPFVGARGYLNPDYTANVTQTATQTGGTLGQQMQRVASFSTAVWLDRIAAINTGRTLRGHLDEALRQQSSSGQPVAITLIVYDLPNRDCAALASNGELLIAQNGLNRYKTEYIDPIAAILADPAYRSLRIVTVIEPDSLPNLVTNLSTAPCAEANSTGAYVQGIRYAITKLHPMSNVYMYLDIAHSGWLGWDTNFNPAVTLFTNTLDAGQGGPGLTSIDGFITDTANYTPTEEPFLPNTSLTVGGRRVLEATFYEFNPFNDELDYATALRNAFIGRGFPNTIGMLIDTSRNGWGGPNRPTAVSTSTDLNTYVDQSRIDRRPHRGGWCNQSGSGIGARPTAAPAAGIDAYVWVKPPGESDGVSSDIPDPTDPAKKFDAMCDPNARNRYNNAFPTNALPGAPHAGQWFPAEFQMLVQNAFPVL
jgi:cellulase/cellobiase CelA1